MRRLGRTEQLGEPWQAGAHIFHRVIAARLRQPRGRPVPLGQAQCGVRVERRRLLARREAQPLLRREVAVVFPRSEEHTSELQSLMRISYAVFCLKKKKQKSS